MVITQGKNSKKVSLLLVLFSTLLFSSFYMLSNSVNITSHTPVDLFPSHDSNVPNQAYSTNISGQGANDFNVTLHQSVNETYGTGDTLYEITNFDSLDNRTFEVDCPTDPNFNSSYAKIDVEDIYAPNKTLEVELGTTYIYPLGTDEWAFSFKVLKSCYLKEFSMCFSETHGASVHGTIDVAIRKAGQSVSNPIPSTKIADLEDDYQIDDGSIKVWYDFTGYNQFLDASSGNTYDKTFFIWIKQTSSSSETKVEFANENDDQGDQKNSSLVYYYSGGWYLKTSPSIDASLKVNLSLLDDTPKPSEINLEINGSAVSDVDGTNSGSWIYIDDGLSDTSGELSLIVTADWWDIRLNITGILVNYTKLLKGTATYFIRKSGADVQWNITLPSAVDGFDSKFECPYINYTIPNNWDAITIKVYNGTNEWLSVSNRPLGNGWREVNVKNSGNGTWILLCNSTNLLSSIDMFIEGTSTLITQASLSSRVVFNATFSSRIATNDGKINLTVYNPDSLSNTLNYSEPILSFSSGKNITLTTWDVDSTVGDIINPLEFRVQCWWHNDTAAGFLETNITLIKEEDTDIELPTTHRTVPRGFIANYTFNYTMETGGSHITDAYIVEDYLYSQLSWSYTENEGVNGNYTIHIDTDNIQNANLNKIFDCNFTIQAIARKAIKINLTITITMPRTEMLLINDNLFNDVISEDLNITLNFTFNDAEKGIPITTITTANISIENIEEPGTQWDRDDPNFPNEGYLLYNHTNGKYSLNISTLGLTRSNSYTLRITINYTSSNPGEYKPYVYNLTFYYASKPDGGGVSPGGGDDDDGGDGDTTIAGIPYELFILIIILVVAGALGTAIAFVIYKKTIVPRKEAKERERAEVMSVFDDALNIEHILVLHPQSGGCIFTRTFRIEEIDPQLIGGFLSAVSSFVKEFGTEEDPLGEITYQNRHILLGDGNFVRVALLLEKKASKYLKQHLTLFIDAFEQEYKAHLEGWQGRIDVFNDAQDLIDQYLNMSIIRPHYIQHEAEIIKKLTSPLSRDLLKVAEKLAQQSKEEKNQENFWISTLLKEGERQLKKDSEDIWVGIKELRDLRILMPIEFVDFGPKAIC